MIKRLLGLALVALVLLGTSVIVFKGKLFSKNTCSFLPFHNQESEESEESEANEKAEIAGAIQYLNSMRADMRTGKVDPDAVYAVYNQVESMPKNKMGGWLTWTEMGPDNVGGRCRALLVDKDNQDLLYAGGVSGGIWRSTNGGSTWQRFGGREVENINVSCIVQGADGSIYYGTGEAGYVTISGGDGNSGFVGRGIFKLTPGSDAFQQLTATDPGGWVKGKDFSNVHKMAADPNDANRIYAAADGGLMISDDAGKTWKKANIAAGLKTAKDVVLSNDGQTIYVAMTNSDPGSAYQLWRSDDRGNNFKRLGASTLPGTSCSYVIAISPTNNNIVYVSSSSINPFGALDGIFRSDDKGENWTRIATGDNVFNPLGNQGYYDHCIIVDPTNADRLILGGQFSMWAGNKMSNGSYQWQQLSVWSPEFYDIANTYRNPYYVHADHHILMFDHKSVPDLYIGSDGGISKSSDITYKSNPTFYNADYGFNTVQFYGMGISAYDPKEVVAGAQDNGVLLVNQAGLTLLNGDLIKGGDGGFSEISKINPNIYFAEYVNGDVQRSFNKGTGSNTWSSFFDSHVPAAGNARYPFIAKFALWESLNDTTSRDSVTYTDPDADHKKGEVIAAHSKSGVDFNVTLTQDLPKGDVLTVQDRLQSMFFMGAFNGIYMTRQAVAPGTTPTWFQIANLPGFTPHDMEYTPDGNTLFVSGSQGTGGAVWRISGLKGKNYEYNADDKFFADSVGITATRIFFVNNQPINGIGLDPNDSNHIVAVLGSYGFTTHVYKSTNAMAASPNFTNIDNGLPDFPVYDALISMSNKNDYLLGTEFGIYSSKDGGKTWNEENEGMDRVPTFQLRQQKFSDKPWVGPVFYAATHGRGVFMSNTLVSGVEPDNNTHVTAIDVNVYPNPAVDFTTVKVLLDKASDVQIHIYDLQGRAVGNYDYARQAEGEHMFRLETSDLKKGTYLVNVKTQTGEKTSKLLIME